LFQAPDPSPNTRAAEADQRDPYGRSLFPGNLLLFITAPLQFLQQFRQKLLGVFPRRAGATLAVVVVDSAYAKVAFLTAPHPPRPNPGNATGV